MPRYFFHTAEGEEQRDPDGFECKDMTSARREAIRYAGAVLQDEPDVLWDGRDFRVVVTDEQDELLFTVVMLTVDTPRAKRITRLI